MKKVLSLILVAVMVITFTACSGVGGSKAQPKTDINIYVITGPTGIGSVNMMEAAANGEGSENYKFTAVSAPDEVVSKISNGEADIAAVSTNLAAKLYQKTSGQIKVLAVNTLGVLYVLTNTGSPVSSVSDLKNRKIYTTGKGANPEYIIDYILKGNGLDPEKDVDLNFKAEGTELVTVWANEPDAVIIAPQPVASSIGAKFTDSKIALDLTEEWNKVSGDSALMMGCIIVRNEFLNNNPTAVENFLKDYEASVKKANEDTDTTAALCEKYGIVAKAAIAKKAIPYCNICFVSGTEMKTGLTGYLNVLLSADPSSVGGKLPDDGFWYEK